ncbi:MAG: hypothetical protein ABIP29_07115 [Candidatus Eisenbacteria bacterium]
MPLHRARPLLLLLIVGCAVADAFSAPPAGATPPRPPLDLRVVLLETPRPGRDVPFAIEVTPLVPGEQLIVTIAPPADAPLVRGRRTETRRDLASGHAQRFTGALRVPPGRRRYVYVRAELVTAGGARYTRGEHLVVLAGPLAAPDPAARTVRDGTGGVLVEYDGARGGR